MNNRTKILRKRFVPDELIDISDDIILFRNNQVLITRWKTIRPKKEFDWGISYTFLKEGYKISRFFDKDNTFVYWYCDIVEIDYKEETDTYVLTDFLVDVQIMPDGKIMVLDLDEMAASLAKNIITAEQTARALESLGKLFHIINNGNFPPPLCKDEKYL
jgi:hypothetical protein